MGGGGDKIGVENIFGLVEENYDSLKKKIPNLKLFFITGPNFCGNLETLNFKIIDFENKFIFTKKKFAVIFFNNYISYSNKKSLKNMIF